MVLVLVLLLLVPSGEHEAWRILTTTPAVPAGGTMSVLQWSAW
jgi:hypothetical protein